MVTVKPEFVFGNDMCRNKKQFLQESLLIFVLSGLLCKVDCLVIHIQHGMPCEMKKPRVSLSVWNQWNLFQLIACGWLLLSLVRVVTSEGNYFSIWLYQM